MLTLISSESTCTHTTTHERAAAGLFIITGVCNQHRPLLGRQTDRQAGRQAGRQTGRQTDRQGGRQTDRQADRKADRQTNR